MSQNKWSETHLPRKRKLKHLSLKPGLISEISASAKEFQPTEAMIWISEIETAKSIADPKTSNSVTRANLQTNFEVLDTKKNCEWPQEDR